MDHVQEKNLLRWNPPREDFPTDRAYAFECLLGARREHRDFVMLGLQQSGCLDQGIVTYRDLFVGHWIDSTPERVAQQFTDTKLQYPYVSANLDPAWEVKQNMDNSVSGLVPWEIYNRTWFSVVCETLGQGRTFLSAEKTAKCLISRRLFVMFSGQHWVRTFRNLGFKTFDSVIDESYDDIENSHERWAKAYAQVKYLCTLDQTEVLNKIHPILEYNYDLLWSTKWREILNQQVLALIDFSNQTT